jgi:hypothetical protein
MSASDGADTANVTRRNVIAVLLRIAPLKVSLRSIVRFPSRRGQLLSPMLGGVVPQAARQRDRATNSCDLSQDDAAVEPRSASSPSSWNLRDGQLEAVLVLDGPLVRRQDRVISVLHLDRFSERGAAFTGPRPDASAGRK